MNPFPHLAQSIAVSLHESQDVGNLRGFEAFVVADADISRWLVEVDDEFTSPGRYMNVGRSMVMQIDHDLVTVDTKNCRHQDIRKLSAWVIWAL
jgi:hypothetical protein